MDENKSDVVGPIEEMVKLAMNAARRADLCAQNALRYANSSGHASVYADAAVALDHASSAALNATSACAEMERHWRDGLIRCTFEEVPRG
jgi:hypothetical protein